MSTSRIPQCQSAMTLPPQDAGRRLRCSLRVHGADVLHEAVDDDNVRRQWPDEGSAAAAAGVIRFEHAGDRLS